MLNRYAKVLISKRHIYDVDKTKIIFSPENVRVRRLIAENRTAPKNKSSVEARSPASYFHYFAARVKRTLFLFEPYAVSHGKKTIVYGATWPNFGFWQPSPKILAEKSRSVS